MASSTHRLIEVPAGRLARWAGGWRANHPGTEIRLTATDLVLYSGAASARIEIPWGPAALDPEDPVTALVSHVLAPRTALILLVRRGGYGVALARDGQVTASKHGTRYVQGRTAAGGWSQQRYARRRAGQAGELASAACAALREVMRDKPIPDVVAVGGDRGLVDQVLTGPAADAVRGLPRSPLLAVPDPRAAVLAQTAQRLLAVRIRIDQ